MYAIFIGILLITFVYQSAASLTLPNSLQTHLVAYYPFDGDVLDNGPNHHDGTAYGASYAADRFGVSTSCFVFDGSTSYVEIEGTPFDLGSALTISFWVKAAATQLNTNAACFDKSTSASPAGGFIVSVPGSTGNHIQMEVLTATNQESSTTTISSDTWTHIVITYDGTAGYITTYINSVQWRHDAVTITAIDPTSDNGTPLPFLIGAANTGNSDPASPTDFFTGSLDEVLIYNVALDQSHVNQLYSLFAPTEMPTGQPSGFPSTEPSSRPSTQPSSKPSDHPSGHPTAQPSGHPSREPSSHPSSQPSSRPSDHPTGHPTAQPSDHPSSQPTGHPSREPTSKPSTQPTSQPTDHPSAHPTAQPSGHPSREPTSKPSTRF